MDYSTFCRQLELIGVNEHTLSAEEKIELDERGYLLIPHVLLTEQIEECRSIFEASYTTLREESHKETGTRHVSLGFQLPEIYQKFYGNPKLLAAASHILRRPFVAFGLHARDPLFDNGQQGLHADWGIMQPNEPYHVVNSIWYLDDSSGINGSTRVVPGTHRYRGQSLNGMKEFIAPHKHHPKEIIIEAKAGSVLIFNGHLFHSGTRNITGKTRRVVICGFAAAEHRFLYQNAQPAKGRVPRTMEFLFG